MNILDIDWVYMRATLLMVVTILLVPLTVVAVEKLDDRFGHKYDAFILWILKKLDEREARKTR